MERKTTHRRNLAPPTPAPEPKASSSMDPTLRKQLKPTTAAAKPLPTTPYSTVAPPSSTIQNISNHFAKLYANHKFLASSKVANGISHSDHHNVYDVDTNLQQARRALPNSTVFDSSCTTLTKSNSQDGRSVADVLKESTRTKLKEKDKKPVKNSHQEIDVEKPIARQKFNEVPKSSRKECNKEEFFHGKDVKKASALMSKSLESDELKKINGVCKMKRPSVSFVMNGGRRKSFGCSQTELADFFSCTGVKVVAVDMPPFMQIHAVDCARKAHDSLEKFTSKSLAYTLKKEFDGVYGPAWHCIIGTSFGSFVTHSAGGFMYFSMDHKFHILLFKTTVQRAD